MVQVSVVLSTEQQLAVERVGEWFANEQRTQILTLGGYAGTGKTTVIRTLMDVFASFGSVVAVCAFTGKAVSVLQKKGIPAVTMHRLMYDPEEEDGKIKFVRKSFLPCDVVVVDEASMVNQSLLDDLVSFGKPILAVGDHGQLEPVGDDPGLMRNPEIKLEKIHRQAEGSPIIRLAHLLREGKVPSEAQRVLGSDSSGIIDFANWGTATSRLKEFEQIICGFNKTRVMLNQSVRHLHGFKGPLQAGERVICLRNNRDHGVFNGQMGTVEKVRDESEFVVYADILMEDGTHQFHVPLNRDVLEGKIELAKVPYDRHTLAFTYGYAVTCHKAQGSEWDNVLLVEEVSAKLWDPARWRYTGVTRAAKKLCYVR